MWLRVCVFENWEKSGGKKGGGGFFKSSGELGPKCPWGSGTPAALRSQPLSLFGELAQDRVGQSWAGVAPLSCKLHPS